MLRAIWPRWAGATGHEFRRLRPAAMVVAVVGAVVVAAGCGNNGDGGSGARGTSDVLRMAVGEIDAPFDPDTYYGSTLLPVTRSAYEGLVRYKPDSPELQGLLATEWTKSDDGLTYTFKLREGVKFADGTPFNANAAKESFQRRIDLDSGPSYMLSKVESMEAPDAQTFVVKLSEPVSPFLSYLGSPWGPVITSPTAIKQRTVDGDDASKWLGTHTAGTGPYKVERVQPGQRIVLTANENYWGDPPHFKTVNIAVIPDVATQRLELEGGSLDINIRGLATRDLDALEASGCCDVHKFPTLQKTVLWVNPESEVFSSPDVRAALRASLNNEELAKELDGPDGVPSTQFFPKGMLPEGAAPDIPEYDPSRLEAALAPYKGRKVVIGSPADDLKTQVLGDILQTRFQALGLDATTRKLGGGDAFAMVSNPKVRTDLYTSGALGPDSVAADTWSQVFYTAKAPANFLGCSVKEGDELTFEAARTADDAKAMELSIQAAEAYRRSNCWLHISDPQDAIVVRKGITGFDHQLTGLLNLAALREE